MKWGWLLCFGIIIIFISIVFGILFVFAYTPPSYDNVTLVLNGTISSYQKDAIATAVSGNWQNGGSQTYDGNWDTFDYGGGGSTGILYRNYTSNSQSAVEIRWQVKDECAIINLTVPYLCRLQSPLQLKAISYDYVPFSVEWLCYNGTSWELVRACTSGEQVYEEGIFWLYGYVPPNYDNVTLVLEGGVAPPPPADSCSCPSPAAHWYIDISDNCNITDNCYNDGYDVHFENGTAGDMVNISAMIVADHFDLQNAGADTIVQTDPGCYLNTS